MSTRDNTPPVGIGLILLGAVSVVVGYMAYALLSYLQSTNMGTQAPDYWILVLGFGMPVTALLGIGIYIYTS
jgi:hypothetical protein